MFIGRKRELEALEELYHQPGFTMSVVYGRRRIGKSTLLAEFAKNKKTIYYTATKVGAIRNLELLSKAVTECLDPLLRNVTFATLEDLFDYVTGRIMKEKVVFVIDELPYWAEKDPNLLSVMQKYIDQDWAAKNLFLILCGSSLSFMESKVLSEKSPLFGRRHGQIKLDAFDYLEAAQFVPDYSYEEKAICYGITGGVAKYLALMNPEKSLDENIKKQFFSPNGYLYDETRNLLAQEFTDTTLVNNVIEQIAAGQNKVNLIASKVHESDASVLYTLNKLISVGLVEKKNCIMEESNKKKVQYTLKDHMFQFWYAYIPQAISVIELGKGDLYYDHVVKPQLHNYMGKVFESMCQQYTLSEGITGRFGCLITQVGSWWGNETLLDKNGKKFSQSADVDVVALSPINKSMAIGECKFKTEKTGKEIYETLVRRGSAIPASCKITKYLFFSLSGFTDWLLEKRDEQIELITLADMYH